MTHNTLSEPQLSVQGAALRMVDLPLSVYSSLAQVHLSTGTKKLVAATALGAASLLFLARHFQRRKRHKKSQSQQWEQASFQFPPPLLVEQDSTSQQITLSLGSKKCGGLLHRELHSRLSGSLQSLVSVKTHDSGSSCTCGNESICWDRPAQEDLCNVVSIPVTTPENLYIMGMELFEEALRSWEQALSFRSRQAEDEVSCGSIQTAAAMAAAPATEDTVEEAVSSEFIQKLECLLQRAYRLQEEFEGALGESEPHSKTSSLERLEDVYLLNLEDVALKDSTSIASNDSFVSAAELAEQRSASSLGHQLFYLEALQLAEDGSVSCRVLRTELLECLGDTDFLAKLHCVRQACQLILSDRTTRTFLVDTGKKILSSIIVKAQKSPKRFEEVFEEMISFLEHAEHWENTEVELATRGIKHLNFYDIVLDFILMDSFEDLENPPVSIQNVVNNRWLNSSFKETAVASSCWSVLKQKRQHMKVPDGFIAHFYAVCEQISPALAWGFLGPKSSLHDFCRFFKDQVLSFLKDIFDLDKVRYSTVESLAEDMLLLLHRRSALLLSYLGADGPRNARPPPTGPHALTEGRDQ
ncbi:mitoguardin 1-like [Gadus chalcogrammus]|uniref:mitoguardin 1-like n=1 Tax=Gadus chalcogrammus TaxID=1042646 RepID=UPI0024C4CD6B|nr:mitoguardin 1-like [Gadus chalcogrammus]XP_056452148.1 mitoguardin 1-like [Gadus chalcogrammus]